MYIHVCVTVHINIHSRHVMQTFIFDAINH